MLETHILETKNVGLYTWRGGEGVWKSELFVHSWKCWHFWMAPYTFLPLYIDFLCTWLSGFKIIPLFCPLLGTQIYLIILILYLYHSIINHTFLSYTRNISKPWTIRFFRFLWVCMIQRMYQYSKSYLKCVKWKANTWCVDVCNL